MEIHTHTRPRVSVILPSHNGERFIERAIKSVLWQQYKDFELIIVNDGSTDSTKKIIEEFAKEDKRIFVINNLRNIGFAKSLNRGMEIARGALIARIDDDDEWICPDKLGRQVAFLDAYKEYVLLGTGIVAIDETGRELGRYLYPADDKEIRSQSLAKCCFAHSSVLFRKEIAIQCGGYDDSSDVRPLEDYDLWLRLGIRGKFANIEDYCVRYLIREGSMSSNKLIQAQRGLTLTNKFRANYPNFVPTIINRYFSLVKYYLLNLLPFSFRVFATTFKSRFNKFIHYK